MIFGEGGKSSGISPDRGSGWSHFNPELTEYDHYLERCFQLVAQPRTARSILRADHVGVGPLSSSAWRSKSTLKGVQTNEK